MANKLPYFQWYPADAVSDRAYFCLTAEEKGVYHMALNASWMMDGLPEDYGGLQIAIQVTSLEFDRCWPKVSKFFKPDAEGILRNSRQEQERSSAKSKGEKSKEAADMRWQKKRDADAHALAHADAYTDAMPRASGSGSVYGSDFIDLSLKENKEVGFLKIDGRPLFEKMVAAFLAGGAMLSEPDMMSAATEWVNAGEEHWERAAAYAEIRARKTEARYLGLPANYLKKREWTRAGPGRIIPEPNQKRDELLENLERGPGF